MPDVALRKESVDRNVNLRVVDGSKSSSLSARRAWIEIVVMLLLLTSLTRSLSARRAWIEMLNPHHPAKLVKVALRKESVDRNVFGFGAKLVHSLSLSARRAWIEIFYVPLIS